jgi:hypothetical protein
VISVDTKKKELLGNYANGGQEWQPTGEPTRVNDHDFADRALGEFAKAIPLSMGASMSREPFLGEPA